MASSESEPTSRRRPTLTKGDRREQQILDVAERLIAEVGFGATTVEAIAKGAGLSRASLYFYFGSKYDVLTALLARGTPRTSPDPALLERTASPEELVRKALQGLAAAWRAHGPAFQAAVEFGAAVPAIQDTWSKNVEAYVAWCAPLVPAQTGPSTSVDLARTLVHMTERTFYWAYVHHGTEGLEPAVETCAQIWITVINHA